MNTTLTTTNNVDFSKVTLTDVNNAILEKVPETLRDITAALMKASQLSSGVSLVMCELLFKVKSNGAALKASGYAFGTYCDKVLRVDPAQATRYSAMYERLYYDVETPYKKLENGGGFTVAQLVEISKLADRAIRKMFIEFDGLTNDCSSTNIRKAVNHLKSFDKASIIAIDWTEVKEILTTGTTKKAEAEKAEAERTVSVPENGKACKFTSFKELEKWIKDNKNCSISEIVISYV